MNVRLYYDIFENIIPGVKRYNVVIMYAMGLWTSYRFPKICIPLVGYWFYFMALFHSQSRRHMIKSAIIYNLL